MGLGACPRCWEDNCICGEYYKNYNTTNMSKHILDILSNRDISEQRTIIREVMRELVKKDKINEVRRKNE